MDIGTHTQVAAVSKIKMATAFLFLGSAALAASAAGGLAGKAPANAPDLVIKSITLDPYVIPEGKGGGPTSGYDAYTITYENIGNVAVTKPFTIFVQSSPNPYQTWGGGDPVMYLANMGDASGNGYSGGFEDLGLKTAASAGNNLYLIPVTSPYGESSSYSGLNKYALNGVSASPGSGWSGGFAPGDVGQVVVYISKFYQDMLGKGGMAKVGAYVDYLKTNRNGVITEKNEQNNTKNVNFGKNNYAVVPSNLCGPDYIAPELAKDICKTQGGSFICIDKYTQWYSACVPNAGDCAKKIKTTVPCEVDLAGGQPYFDTIEVGIGGNGWEATKTFKLSYAMGTYSTIDGKTITLFYPYDKKDEMKMVRANVTMKNADTLTSYGFYQEGDKSKSYNTTYPDDWTSAFTNKFVPNIVWGNKTGYQFKTDSAYTSIYFGVKNNDDVYFGFPNSKIADDAIVLQIMPEPATSPATSTPPYPPTPTPSPEPNLPPSALQPSIKNLELSGPGLSMTFNMSKVQGNLPEYPDYDSSWKWDGPTDITAHINAYNTDPNTEYAFYVKHNGSMNVNFLLSSYPYELNWSKSPDFSFSTKDSFNFTVYAFVRNGDSKSITSLAIDDYTYKTIQKKYEAPPSGGGGSPYPSSSPSSP